ncbi:alpha/beta hydrolase [Chitinispirillum alkaliphilum]|nr:alpha/beta hydrolase [Chitinispirillum alkaliphilum]
MSDFILVHGAAQGGWCWHKVKGILEGKGHTVYTPDLPGHEPQSILQPHEITFDLYVKKILDTLSEASGNVILVGHSMGGAVITKVIDILGGKKIKKAVFVSGFIPEDGEIIGELLKTDTGSELKECFEINPDKMSVRLLPESIGRIIYNGCSDEDIEYAKMRVVSQSVIPIGTPIRLSNPISIPRVGIVCTMDKSLTSEMQEMFYRRAGCEIRYLESGHAPFFFRPFELVQILLEKDCIQSPIPDLINKNKNESARA